MESYIIWIAAGVVVVVVFVPYYFRFRKSQKLMMLRKEEARELGIDHPRAQFPMINASLCIGCGSCVAACPEGDVLGVVKGVATIINGERCVGHGYCEQVCPVGALKVGLGDIKTRPDIPIMNETNETTVPGLYIAGELGGLSLIRNAIAQGKMVIEKLAQDPDSPSEEGVYDVVIVGAGPAGLSAALTAIEHHLSYVVLDEQQIGGTIMHYPRKKLVMTQPVEIPLYGWLKQTEYSKEQLVETWQNIVEKFNMEVKMGERVEYVQRLDDRFQVLTAKGVYEARHVVLAMGRRGTPRKLEVPGEDLPKVMYKLIDACSYTGCNLLVVGGGDSAVEAAIGLARQSKNNVTISYRKTSFFRVKKKNETAVNQLITAGKIKPLWESQVKEVREQSVILESKSGLVEIANDFVFVFIGGVPPFKMLQEMGIAFGGETKCLLDSKETAAVAI